MYAFGHLYFELVTRMCSVNKKKCSFETGKLSDTAECKVQGILFTGIIAKATATRPDSRYEDLNFMLDEIYEWQVLESTAQYANLGKPRLERLRHFWHIEQGIKRRIYATSSKFNSFLDASIPYVEYLLDRFSDGGELDDDWLKPHISKIDYNT